MESSNTIEHIQYCKTCPYYLTEKDKHIEFGNGDITCKTIIVLNKYGDKLTKYYIDLIKNIYKREFNKEIFEDYYITFLPKCYNYSINKYHTAAQAITSCKYVFLNEINYYCRYYNKIVIFDDILSNVILNSSLPISNVNIICASTPANTYKFIKEFKLIMKNDKNLGI